MATYTGDEIDPISYNFHKWLEDEPDVTVTVKEPTNAQIATYFTRQQRLVRNNIREMQKFENRRQAITGEDADGTLATPITDDQQAQLDALDDEYLDFQEAQTEASIALRCKLLSDLCSGTPSAELLQSLPGRALGDFERYIRSELTPKDETPDTN